MLGVNESIEKAFRALERWRSKRRYTGRKEIVVCVMTSITALLVQKASYFLS